jgi:hypothetical protein
MGHVVGSLFSAPALRLFLMSLVFFLFFLACSAFFHGCEEEERIVCYCEFQILMFGPPTCMPIQAIVGRMPVSDGFSTGWMWEG